MRAALVHDRVVWWPRIRVNSYRTLVSASDPSVPPGLPVTVDVVAKHVGRDSAQTPETWHPVQVGTAGVWSGWVRHDPACPAAAHESLRALVNRRQTQQWSAMTSVAAAAATDAWVFASGQYVETSRENSQARMAVSIDQAGATTPPCTWWVANDVGRFIG